MINYSDFFSGVYGLSAALLFLFFRLIVIKKWDNLIGLKERKLNEVVEILTFQLLLSSFLIQILASFPSQIIESWIADLILIGLNIFVIYFIVLGRYFKFERKEGQNYDLEIYICDFGAKFLIYWVLSSILISIANNLDIGGLFFDEIIGWNFIISSVVLGIIWIYYNK